MKEGRWLLVIAGLLAAYSGSSQSPSANRPKATVDRGLKGEYFSGRNFDKKVFTRIDPQIDFDWNWRTPGPGMPRSFYSVRWTGKLYAPVSGTYHFKAEVDDGIRLWINGKMVLESWQLNDNRHFEGAITLQAGQYYDLRVDYFNDILSGEIQVYWLTPNAKPTLGIMPYALLPGQFLFEPKYQPPKPVVAQVKKLPVPNKVKQPVVAQKPVVIKPPVVAKAAPPVVRPSADTASKSKLPLAAPIEDVKLGQPTVLKQVSFAQSEYTLLPQSSTELDKLAKTLSQHPDFLVEISGHTDNVGDPRLNLALSENRAKVVATYLVRQGIGTDRITAKGYGCTRPLNGNHTEQERVENRRVEFILKPK